MKTFKEIMEKIPSIRTFEESKKFDNQVTKINHEHKKYNKEYLLKLHEYNEYKDALKARRSEIWYQEKEIQMNHIEKKIAQSNTVAQLESLWDKVHKRDADDRLTNAEREAFENRITDKMNGLKSQVSTTRDKEEVQSA